MKETLLIATALCATLACKSEKRPTPFAGSAAAVVAPPPVLSASVVSPPPPARKVALGLETETIGAGPSVRVLVTAPALQLREPVAEIRFPFACVAVAPATEQAWRVSCSPRYRHPVAKARFVEGELVLQVFAVNAPVREIRRRLPPTRVIEMPEAEASSRIESCDGIVPTREVNVTFPSANWYSGFTPDTITYLALPGLAEPLPLVKENRWWRGCHGVAVDGAVEFQCPAERHHFARITAEAGAVRYEWHDTERHVGRVLLPCSVKAKLVAPATFNMGNRYF